jgi:hypothetical protein
LDLWTGPGPAGTLRGNGRHGPTAAGRPSFKRQGGGAGGPVERSARPVFKAPRGVKIEGYFRPADDRPKRAKLPYAGFGYLRFHFYFRHAKTGEPVPICCSADEILVSVNDPGRGLEPFSERYFPSLVLYEPKRVGDVGGLPVYRLRNGSEVMILSRRGLPPWQPLTREEFLEGEIARLKKEVADSPPIDTVTPQLLKNHQAALEAMPAEERRLQARYFAWDPLQPMLAPVGSTQGDPLVRVTPTWFDPHLPRTAFQLIVLRFGFGGGLDPDAPKPPDGDNIAPYRIWQALHTSDWREVSRALTDE